MSARHRGQPDAPPSRLKRTDQDARHTRVRRQSQSLEDPDPHRLRSAPDARLDRPDVFTASIDDQTPQNSGYAIAGIATFQSRLLDPFVASPNQQVAVTPSHSSTDHQHSRLAKAGTATNVNVLTQTSTTTLAIRSNLPTSGSRTAHPNREQAAEYDDDDNNADDDDDDDFKEFPFTALKNTTCQYFVKIPIGDFKQRVEFLAANIEILDKTAVGAIQIVLLQQAVEFSRMSKDTATVACIFCLALVRMSKDQKHLSQFFRHLQDPNSDEKKAYSLIVKQIQKTVTDKAQADGALSPPARRSSYRRRRRTQALPTSHTLDSDLFVSPGIEPELTIEIPNAPPIPSALSPKYKVRPATFFVLGKVFSVLWHEATSKDLTASDLVPPLNSDRKFTQGPHGETIFSHFRRMIVVKKRRAACFCVSIATYEGRGLGKPGFQRDEINAHAITHDSTKPVEYLKGEPHTNKRPVRIKMTPGERLDKASRVHLGKPYNVEFNVKVMDVGQVHSEDLLILLAMVKNELAIDTQLHL